MTATATAPAPVEVLHREDSRRYIVAFVGERWFPACTCGWEGPARVTAQDALRATLALHLDDIPMRLRG